MSKILVLSDSHGDLVYLQKIIDMEWPFDRLIHCGDGVGDLMNVDFPYDIPIATVSGNVDLGRFSGMDRIDYDEVGGIFTLITHGDLFEVKYGYDKIKNFARKEDVGLICFGHTHQQFLELGSLILFNPGAVRDGLYGLIMVDSDINFHKCSVF